MKNYETWEVIKMLSENPKLKFVVTETDPKDDVNLTLSVNDLGNLIFENKWKSGQYFGSLLKNKWKLVKEHVDFMVAINAYHEGKTIYCLLKDGDEEFQEIFNPIGNATDWGFAIKSKRGLALDTGFILFGEWFIEE